MSVGAELAAIVVAFAPITSIAAAKDDGLVRADFPRNRLTGFHGSLWA